MITIMFAYYYLYFLLLLFLFRCHLLQEELENGMMMQQTTELYIANHYIVIKSMPSSQKDGHKFHYHDMYQAKFECCAFGRGYKRTSTDKPTLLPSDELHSLEDRISGGIDVFKNSYKNKFVIAIFKKATFSLIKIFTHRKYEVSFCILKVKNTCLSRAKSFGRFNNRTSSSFTTISSVH